MDDVLERAASYGPSYGDRGDMIDLIADLAAEVLALRADRERLEFVLRHCLPIELWFSSDEMITVDSIDEIDAALSSRGEDAGA